MIKKQKEGAQYHGTQTIHTTVQNADRPGGTGEIASESNLNPNMIRNWKKEFLANASSVFEDPRKAEKEAKKKADAQRRETARMLKTIGQLTPERDFLRDCFRLTGEPVPEFDPDKL